MPIFKPTVEDIDAAGMVLRDISELSDSLSAEEALDYRLAIEALRTQGANTISDLDTQLRLVLEKQVERHGRYYWIGRKKESERFLHGKIAGAVIRRALEPDDNGEIPDAATAVRRAVALMSGLYLSPSTKAKIGKLSAIGLNTDRDNTESVRIYELGEKELKHRPIGGGDE